MKHFLDLEYLTDLKATLETAAYLKKHPYEFESLGKRKTLGLLFFNSSLRTRLSTQKAAQLLGMQTIVMNFSNEGWNLEFEDGVVMNADKAEHIREAAAVISSYVDVLAVRAFPDLKDRERDEAESIIKGFAQYGTVPVINLESATAHPLQALADALTLKELNLGPRPKVVLSWAPHPRALPHAVPNSFVKMMSLLDTDLHIAQPPGYELNPGLTQGATIHYDQEEALKDADIVYVKNWSSYQDYGKILSTDQQWMMTQQKLGQARFMHCLPVRRNVVVADEVLNGPSSVVIQQADNRTWTAMAVLKSILEHIS